MVTMMDRENREMGDLETGALVISLQTLEAFTRQVKAELFHRFREGDTTELGALKGEAVVIAQLVESPRPHKCEACDHEVQRAGYIRVFERGEHDNE